MLETVDLQFVLGSFSYPNPPSKERWFIFGDFNKRTKHWTSINVVVFELLLISSYFFDIILLLFLYLLLGSMSDLTNNLCSAFLSCHSFDLCSSEVKNNTQRTILLHSCASCLTKRTQKHLHLYRLTSFSNKTLTCLMTDVQESTDVLEERKEEPDVRHESQVIGVTWAAF